MERSRADAMGELAILERIQRKVLWLATWMVHWANTRPNPDGTKVGGHQASSASVVSLLTALYFKALRPDDLVAVKAHASPAFYAIQYLRGRLPQATLAELRSFGRLHGLDGARRRASDVRRAGVALRRRPHGRGRSGTRHRHGRRRRAGRGQRLGGALRG